jgi:hypothetical protein
MRRQGPTKTRATYSTYTDSGGAIPAFIANAASEVGIRRLFAAVRKQVKHSNYSATARSARNSAFAVSNHPPFGGVVAGSQLQNTGGKNAVLTYVPVATKKEPREL